MSNNPFTSEQLAYLHANFAEKPHTHTWQEVKDAEDGQTVKEAFENVDTVLDELQEGVPLVDEDEDDEDETV